MTRRSTEQWRAAQERRRRAGEVIQLARNGHNSPAIAKMLGIDPATVRRLIKVDRAGGIAELRPRHRVDRAEIRRLAAAGVPNGEIGRRLKLSQPAIRRVLKSDPQDDVVAQIRDVEKERRLREVRQLHDSGLSQMAIAAALGIERHQVRYALWQPPLQPQRAPSDDLSDSPRGRALAVLALLDQGVPRERIAARLHVSFSTINRVRAIENAGGTATIQLRRPLRGQRSRQRLRSLQVRALASGTRPLGPTAIAKRLGLSILTVRRHLDVEFRSEREIAAQRRLERKKERAQKVCELHAQGCQDAIAKELVVIFKQIVPSGFIRCPD